MYVPVRMALRGMLICLSVVILVAIGNVLVDPALVGSTKFSGTQTPHQWNSGDMPYDVVMVMERCNGPRRLRDDDDDDVYKYAYRILLVVRCNLHHLFIWAMMITLTCTG